MLESFQARLLRMLRVPPEPDPPLGDPASARVFRAAPGFLRYRILTWGSRQVGAAVGLAFGIATLAGLEAGLDAVDRSGLLELWSGLFWIRLAEVLAIGFFLLQLLPSLLLVVLDYRYRWYVVTDRSLRIREGLWKVEERTMTFSNVQNVSVRQGPLQRLFGIADLQVQTAGGGGKSDDQGQGQGSTDKLHIGVFRGVANADEIRDAILARLRRLRSSGLGDPEETADAAPGRDLQPAALAAARAVLRETRSLAAALRGP